MRSVYRKLGSSFCALSAALLLGVCAVSFWWQYHYLARDWTGRLEVYVGRSIVHIARDHRSKYFGGWATEKGFRRIGPGWFSNDPNIGFQYQRFNGDFKGVMDFYIPLLVPALLLAGATLRVWRGGRQKGHCRKCGYNLYGVTGPRCPECGATPRPDDFYLARPTPAPRIANASFFRMA
ncbi:MAG TPA: hypothetical protein VMV81_04805, partial [Phycisphaerae bacterium]|nr:hypothetical protein [Phycisphaerae bacterium]